MRTTVDIPDSLYRKLKSTAALRGCSVKELIVRGVETELSRKNGKRRQRINLPIIESKKPGHLNLTNKLLNEILLS